MTSKYRNCISCGTRVKKTNNPNLFCDSCAKTLSMKNRLNLIKEYEKEKKRLWGKGEG